MASGGGCAFAPVRQFIQPAWCLSTFVAAGVTTRWLPHPCCDASRSWDACESREVHASGHLAVNMFTGPADV